MQAEGEVEEEGEDETGHCFVTFCSQVALEVTRLRMDINDQELILSLSPPPP